MGTMCVANITKSLLSPIDHAVNYKRMKQISYHWKKAILI